MANISKADLIKELTEKTGMGQKDVKTLVEGMLESVTGFLELSRIQTVMLSEYVLRTPAWLARAER